MEHFLMTFGAWTLAVGTSLILGLIFATCARKDNNFTKEEVILSLPIVAFCVLSIFAFMMMWYAL